VCLRGEGRGREGRGGDESGVQRGGEVCGCVRGCVRREARRGTACVRVRGEQRRRQKSEIVHGD